MTRNTVSEITERLPCPECRARKLRGGILSRLGNNRSQCGMCNRFNQNVRRISLKRILEEHPDIYAEIRRKVELDLYPQYVEEFNRQFPELVPEDIRFDDEGKLV